MLQSECNGITHCVWYIVSSADIDIVLFAVPGNQLFAPIIAVGEEDLIVYFAIKSVSLPLVQEMHIQLNHYLIVFMLRVKIFSGFLKIINVECWSKNELLESSLKGAALFFQNVLISVPIFK